MTTFTCCVQKLSLMRIAIFSMSKICAVTAEHNEMQRKASMQIS